MTKQQYLDYQAAVERRLRGLEGISTGACPGCAECGLEHAWRIDAPRAADGGPCEAMRCLDSGPFDTEADALEELDKAKADPACAGVDFSACFVVDTAGDEHRRELAEDPSFSWHACDCCGSRLGGERHPAHGLMKREGQSDLLVHLTVCVDCLYYITYGQLDDLTMLGIGEEA